MSSQVRSYTRGTSPSQGDMVGVVLVVAGALTLSVRCWKRTKKDKYLIDSLNFFNVFLFII